MHLTVVDVAHHAAVDVRLAEEFVAGVTEDGRSHPGSTLATGLFLHDYCSQIHVTGQDPLESGKAIRFNWFTTREWSLSHT